jgi:radical SAM superfamily enzyme YgiQ (UPF0313 family)
MRVAIVIPPIRDFYFTPQRASFLGPLTLSRLLEKAGIEHRVFNAVRTRGRPIKLPVELSYLSRYLGMPGFFREYRRYGIEDEVMALRIAEWNPEIVLISCFAFGYAMDAISLSRTLRRVLPRTVQYAGGAGVSAYPEYFIRHGDFDYAVKGEVDASLAELITRPEEFHAGDSIITDPRMLIRDASFLPVVAKMHESVDTAYFSTMTPAGFPAMFILFGAFYVFRISKSSLPVWRKPYLDFPNREKVHKISRMIRLPRT